MATKSASPAKRRPAPRRATPKPKPVPARSPKGPVESNQVELVRTKGTKIRGGGPGGEAWSVSAAGQRAGTVFINVIDEPPVGPHASIQIFLNRASQGRRIGRVGYLKACEQSAHDVIYAHMRRSNVASRRAAEEAGFVDVTPPNHTQLLLKRDRGGKAAPEPVRSEQS